VAKKNILTKGKKARAEQLALGNRLEDALVLYANVCKIDPMDVEAWVKAGVIQCRLGHYAEAESSARRALMLAPNLAFAQHTLATVLQYQGKTEEASTLLEGTLKQHPDSAENLLNLARLREKQGRMQEAFDLYHRILRLQPESPYVLAKQGELLEKAGRLEEAEAVIARGLTRDPLHPELNLIAARLARRAGLHDEAATRLEAMLNRPMSPETSAEAHILLGQLHDLLGNTQTALRHCLEGKRRVALAIDPDGSSSARFLSRVVAARNWLSDRPDVTPQSGHTAESPVFLIGFLRSGTTLLEQILDSHPRLQSLDEKPMAEVMEQAFISMTGGRPESLAELSEEQISELRQVYWEEVARHCDRQTDTWLVDKQPFNIFRVPLLWRVFPDARFILAVRHPCDVVLGCLMQNFSHTNAMASFSSLGGIAELYARVMSTWLEYADRLPLRWQRIRYEDMVTNFETEVGALLAFLDVGWDDAVLQHTEHAKGRGLISTPSYHQVTQPIYQHAKYRWKHYEDAFGPIMATLRPFIDGFGYRE